MAMGTRIIVFIMLFHIALYLAGYGWGVSNIGNFVNAPQYYNQTSMNTTLSPNASTVGAIQPVSTGGTGFVGGLVTIIFNALNFAWAGINFLFTLVSAPIDMLTATTIPFVVKLILGVPLAVMYMLAVFAFWKGNEI